MDKKLKNSKGFTLIELIGIIIILALIALITYPIIGNIVDKVNKTVCDLNSYAVAEAAENYMVKEGKKLPDNGIFNVPLKILRENNLVSKILDPLDKKVECDGYAVIQRKERGFEIDGHVICPNYCNSDEYVSDDKDNKLGVGEYYVGANPNNWVMFGRYHQSSVYGILWRMVKTDEGGIKLIFEGVENGGSIPLEDGRTLHGSTAGVQYDKNSTNPFDKSTLNIKLNNWLDNLAVINKYDYVKKTNWKIGGIPFYNPTFKDTFIEFEGIDSETNYGKYRGLSELSGIGLLNPSDFMHTSSNTACTSSYKTGGSSNPCAFNEEEKNNFLYKNKYHYWTMNASSDTANKAWYINNIGQITTGMTNSSVISVRPVINLDSDTVFISGSGTIDDPYIIEDYMVDIKNKPLITLNGQEKIVLREGDSYTELGAIAEDPEDGDISNKIVISSDLNVNIPGTYEIEYNVKDSDGNKAPTVIRTVVVSPKESPIITIIGDNPLKITLKNSYVELGATASDPFYGDISGNIVIAGEVNTNELGIYEITYSVTNKDGLEAIPVIRKVIVEPSRPVIKLNGESPTNVYVGSSYIEEGATAFDSVDGDITNQIEKEITRYETVKSGNGYKTKDSIVSEVIVEKKYRYRIVYKVTNTYGVTSSVTRSINILPDDGPEIAFEPEKSNSAKKSHGVKVTVTKRQYDVDPSSVKYMWINSKWEMPRNTTLENLIRTSFKSGSTLTISGRTELYKLYVIAKDIHGNTTIKSTGYFRLDNSIPVIRLNGSNPYRVLIGKTYQEFGATAYDEYYSGNLTSRIEIDSSSVDTNKECIYYVSYSVKDNAENERIVYRRVEVYLSKPKITLNGNAHEKVVLGRQYIEKGATTLTINNSSSNAVVTGRNYIGGLAGYIYSTSSIKNSYASGDVSGTGYIGGLIGIHNSGTITITSSYATGNVTGTSYYVGGLAGYIYSSNVSYAYTSGAVEGLDSVGGLFGNTRGGSVSKSYASGNVKSKTTTSNTGHGTGGLIGYNRSTLYDTFSAGSVTRGGTSGYIGGLVGYNYTGSINRSYVLGKLTNARAFVGAVNSLTAINTYFIGETTGVVSGSYVTKIESKIEATYSSRYEGFNFDTIWGIEYGATTPYLRGLTIPEEVYIIG